MNHGHRRIGAAALDTRKGRQLAGPDDRACGNGLIDVHAHFLPQTLLDALRARSESPRLLDTPEGTILDYGRGYVERIGDTAGDLDRLLGAMDRSGVTMSVISINQPGVVGMPAAEAVAIARDANAELLDHVTNNSSRLAGLGTLPLQDADAAASELEWMVSAGLSGAIIVSNVNGTSIADPQFAPVFEAAARLEAPLLLHPILPIDAERFKPYALTVPFGFLVDTTMAATHLVLAGIYDRHPRLRLIIGHAGSLLPQIAGRIDLEAERNPTVRGRLSVLPSQHLKRMYTDTVGGSAPAVRSALSLFGATQVMFGSDYPFWAHGPAVDVMSELARAGELPDGIEAENAIRLFGLGQTRSVGTGAVSNA